jgi:hypothetical protein
VFASSENNFASFLALSLGMLGITNCWQWRQNVRNQRGHKHKSPFPPYKYTFPPCFSSAILFQVSNHFMAYTNFGRTLQTENSSSSAVWYMFTAEHLVIVFWTVILQLSTIELICFSIQTNSVALSPQGNYTDWATAICRLNLVPTFVDRGMSRGQRGGSSTVVNLSFLDRSRYFSFK